MHQGSLAKNRELYELAVKTLDELPKRNSGENGIGIITDTGSELRVGLGDAVFHGIDTRAGDTSLVTQYKADFKEAVRTGVFECSGAVGGNVIMFYIYRPDTAASH